MKREHSVITVASVAVIVPAMETAMAMCESVQPSMRKRVNTVAIASWRHLVGVGDRKTKNEKKIILDTELSFNIS